MLKRSLAFVRPRHVAPRKLRPNHAAFLSNIPSFASTREHGLNKPTSSSQIPPSSKASSSRPHQVLKYSLTAFAFLLASALSAYEITHLYTEHVAMSPESDHQVKQWGWDFATYWTGDTSHGGTDPKLRNRIRHLIHAAWGASEWDLGPNANLQSSSTTDRTSSYKIVDARLLTTEKYLRAAIEFIEAENTVPNIHPSTLPQLRLQHALVLEQMEPQYWNEAKEEFTKAWKDFPEASHRGFLAWKLGDINQRLGLDTEAQEWWNKATNIVQERHPDDCSTSIESMPQSPLLQRVLFSTLVSKSAYLARHDQLKEAQQLEESALKLLRSIHPPESFASSTPPQALHALYLLQRSSIFSIHLAEVLYAQKRKWNLSAQYLQSAAESSGRVARMLTEGQNGNAIQNSTAIPLSSEKLLSVYDTSRSMNKPAHVLLRDARRTAAEAWNLLGVLHEAHEGTKSQSAVECFKQAMIWAGSTSPNGIQEAGDSTLESDWRIYKNNFERLTSQISANKS